MITQADLDECHAWIEASAEHETRMGSRTPAAKRETSSEAPHPDEPAAQSGAGALAPPCLTIHGTAPAPAVPVFPRADQLIELGRMRECVQLLAEEIEAGWQRIIEEQQRLGWPDFDKVRDATHALHRASTDLDNRMHEAVFKLRWKPQGK
jgi:hypothetical protein